MKKLVLLLIVSLASLFGLVACESDSETKTEQKTEVPAVDYKKELADGVSFLKQFYAGKGFTNGEILTMSDYDLVGKSVKCSVEWTVEVTSGNAEDVKVVKNDDGSYTIDVVEKAAEDVLYKLVATVKAGDGSTQAVTYTCKVAKYALNTHEEYIAAEKDAPLVVEGVVTAVLSKDAYGDKTNELYLQGTDGGYYAYALEADPVADGIKVGMTVRVSGSKGFYGQTSQLVKATYEIVDSTIKTVTPHDITELYTTKALDDASLQAYQGALVTIKGVTIGSAGDNGYRYFSLEGKQTYIRISSSTCPLNPDDTQSFEETFLTLTGHQANVTGVVSLYDGKIYLQPVDLNCIEDLGVPQLTEAEKVAAEKAALADFDTTKFGDGATVTLPAAGSTQTDVVITWESKSEQIVITDGVAKVTTNNQTVTVTLVATLTCGDASDTKEITFVISAEPNPTTTTVSALATTAPTTGKDMIYIVEATWETKEGQDPTTNNYGNGNLVDADGSKVVIYGLSSSKAACLTYANETYSYKNAKDFLTLDVKDGDVIKVGMIYDTKYSNYSAYLIEVVAKATTIKELATNAPTESKKEIFIVEGIWETKEGLDAATNKYGNGNLKDSEGNSIVIYGLSSSKDKCLSFSAGSYSYKNPQDFLTLGIIDGSIVRVGMIYDTDFKNYSAYLINIVGTIYDAMSDEEKVAFDRDGIVVDAETVADIKLPTSGIAGSTISWSSDNEAVISNAGVVVRPAAGSEDVVVTLTATITSGAATVTKTFQVTVKAELDSNVSMLLATFDFGNKGSAGHVDGNDLGTSKSFTADGYTLALSSMSKVFGTAYDSKGNSCIKLGTSSKTGTFKFTVGAEVKKVVIYVAGYKAATSTNIKINGTQHTVKTASNNGQYTAIEIDTTTTKTITFLTVTYRCMIDKIEFHS